MSATRLGPDELAADDECLGEPVGPWLRGVLTAKSPLLSGTEQLLESRKVLRASR